MRVGSLASGVGGLDLAVEAVFGAELAWYAEIDKDAGKVMGRHWPGVPNLGDITAVDWSAVQSVDIIASGFPCQPWSQAGARKGHGDERWLWPYIVTAIAELEPTWVVIENVPGITQGRWEEDVNRCLCGWAGGWGGLHPAGSETTSGIGELQPTGGHSNGRACQTSFGGTPQDLRGQALRTPSGEPTEARGLHPLDAVRDGGGRVSSTGIAIPPAEDGAGTTRHQGLRDPRVVGTAPLPWAILDTGSTPTVREHLRGDRQPQPQGPSSQDGPDAGAGCPVCGEPNSEPATRSVFRSGLQTVLGDLAALNFVGRYGHLSAAAVGACHRRERVFIVAHAGSPRQRQQPGEPLDQQEPGRGQPFGGDRPADNRHPVPAAHPDGDGREGPVAGVGGPQRGQQAQGRGHLPAHAGSAGLQGRGQSSAVRGWALPAGMDHPVVADALSVGRQRGQSGRLRSGDESERGEEPVHPEHGGYADEVLARMPDGTTRDYGGALRRHAAVLGRPWPPPLKGRTLNGDFSEWMMMLPEGWLEGVSNTAKKRLAGNSVVPLQAMAAILELR